MPWHDALPLGQDDGLADDWPDPCDPPTEAHLTGDLDGDDAGPDPIPLPAPAPQRATDAEMALLVARVMRQDEAALSELYACMAGPVYTVALRITRRVDLGEEVLQDTFWQVWRQAPRFDPQRGSAAAWIMTIARSRAMDAARASQRALARQASAADAELNGPCEPTGSDPLDLLNDVRRDSLLHAALARLDPLRRQLVGLAFYRGFTHEEIASQMDLPLGTVKSHLRRALAAMRQALGAA